MRTRGTRSTLATRGGFIYGGDVIIAPTLLSVEVGAVADDIIVMTYDEDLDTGSVPATGDFALVGSALATVSSVGVAGAAVTLTLSEDIYDFEVIKFTYTAGANPIRDLAHNNAANISSQAVTNNGNDTCVIDSETLDYSDLSLTDAQVNAHIAGLSTCTNCTINIAGTNAHRTSASNDDLNTLLANDNTITLNDVLGDELHTSLNAANDSATEAITAFADHAATIDGATKVTIGNSVLDMIPQGAELVDNGDFANWTGGDSALNVSDCENISYDAFSGASPTAFKAAKTTSGTKIAGTADEIIFVSGQKYTVAFDMVLNSGAAPKYNLHQNLCGTLVTDDGYQEANAGANSFEFTANQSTTGVLQFNNTQNTNFEISNLSVTTTNDDPDDWTVTGESGVDPMVTEVSGACRIYTSTDVVQISQDILTAGKYYVTTIDVDAAVSGDLQVYFGELIDEISSTGTKIIVGRATSASFVIKRKSGATDFTIDNVSVKELQVLGSDLVTNGSFTDDTDWVKGTGWTISGGTANCDGSQSDISYLTSKNMFTSADIGDSYIVKYTVSNYSAGTLRVYIASNSSNGFQVIRGDGTYTEIRRVGATGNDFLIRADADFIGSVDNVSVFRLLDQKTIENSTAYSDTHYYLPVDENSYAIPVDYTAEGIVSQLMSGESNLTTNWSVANNALVTSVTSPVNVGNFAISVESNSTPTADADADIDITVENAAVYRLSVDHRHGGSGDDWILEVEGETAGTLDNTETTYATKVYYFTAGDTTCTIRYKENNESNNGEVIFDNLSLKKVTLS